MFENLSPNQKQLLMIGVPVVSVFALVSYLGKKNTAASTTATTTGEIAATGASDSVLGTGQLADYESTLGGQLNDAVNQLTANQAASNQQISQDVGAQIASMTAAQQQDAGQIQALAAQLAPTPVNSANYPVVGPAGSSFDILGTISGAGGQYTGENVGGGAPVYAFVNNQWQQNFDPTKLQVGTAVATPSTFGKNIVSGVTTEQL